MPGSLGLRVGSWKTSSRWSLLKGLNQPKRASPWDRDPPVIPGHPRSSLLANGTGADDRVELLAPSPKIVSPAICRGVLECADLCGPSPLWRKHEKGPDPRISHVRIEERPRVAGGEHRALRATRPVVPQHSRQQRAAD